MLLGAVADDLTGATDLALMLAREGMRTIQVVGAPQDDLDIDEADAVVVALKSRTIPAAEAVELSLAATEWLIAGGAEQIVFKYCSTFDSTPKGNIGPVLDALQAKLGVPLAIACPAFPTNGRTVYQGHLFVGDMLLSDSPMKDHPLTPMTDANLMRVLGAQSKSTIGLVPFITVAEGAAAIRAAFDAARQRGCGVVIVDAVTDDQLRAIGEAAADMKLVTGGSGIALGLPGNFRRAGKLRTSAAAEFRVPPGRGVIFAGSCSAATRRQVAHAMDAGLPALRIDPLSIASGKLDVPAVVEWIVSRPEALPLVYSSADPQDVAAAQEALGRHAAGEIVETLLGSVAAALRERGFSRFIVAGGETSGAVVKALGVPVLRIGPEIDPGVPWTVSVDDCPVALALKSGNFGSDDFFLKAWSQLA
ncbi:Uncharacterized conserved protein YgbK, DUF1537 family [Xaviernesmea oryzae]|uniref:3-oxo-tetronate kinase n=1 Tax=Xaviernesmea oryzae TaxID=464029 RepID=A0A1X7DT20_9HYPH|nr:3-oxo-tetronate kinase [Xaviernesmea oryzae]SMF21105.1 Uncharacterized conserved protein YgbK, DUF1537 family [Xaviernesmea oryzae]